MIKESIFDLHKVVNEIYYNKSYQYDYITIIYKYEISDTLKDDVILKEEIYNRTLYQTILRYKIHQYDCYPHIVNKNVNSQSIKQCIDIYQDINDLILQSPCLAMLYLNQLKKIAHMLYIIVNESIDD